MYVDILFIYIYYYTYPGTVPGYAYVGFMHLIDRVLKNPGMHKKMRSTTSLTPPTHCLITTIENNRRLAEKMLRKCLVRVFINFLYTFEHPV